MIVQIRRHHLYYFRKKAFRSDVEVYAMLFGVRISPTYVDVLSFRYPRIEFATSIAVKAEKKSYEEILAWGTSFSGWSFLGDIHSHPFQDPAPSRDDIRDHKCNRQMISGVVGFVGGTECVQFWEDCSPVPCTIKYVK